VKPDQRVSVVGVVDEEIRVFLRERGIRFGEEPQLESDAILFRAESLEAPETATSAKVAEATRGPSMSAALFVSACALPRRGVTQSTPRNPR
jgi:hypothetical protein